MNKYRAAVKLSKSGRNHLAYLNLMQDKEYDIPDGTPEDRIDDLLLDVMLKDLDAHKAECAGCSQSILDEIKGRLHR